MMGTTVRLSCIMICIEQSTVALDSGPLPLLLLLLFPFPFLILVTFPPFLLCEEEDGTCLLRILR